MPDYRLRFHLLRLPQLDSADAAGQRSALGFALGIDADFDPSAFNDTRDGHADRLLQALRTDLAGLLPDAANAAAYEQALAARLGAVMPWCWRELALSLRDKDGQALPVQWLDLPLQDAQQRLPLYRYLDRRVQADDPWTQTIYAPATAASNWSAGGDIVLQPDGFAPWPAILATLAQETAPVGVRYFGLYRLFRLDAARLAAGTPLRCESLRWRAQDAPFDLAFAGQEDVEAAVTLGGSQVRVLARCAALDPTLDPGWEQAGGWLAQTQPRQGPGLDVLPGRLLPWFDRSSWLLAQDVLRAAGDGVAALDARLGFGARFDAGGALQLGIDGGNLIRVVVDKADNAGVLEDKARLWQPAGDSARLQLLLTDAAEALPASCAELAESKQPLEWLATLSAEQCIDRLRELRTALLQPASLQRRFQRLWQPWLPAEDAGWQRMAQIDLPRRIELDAGSAGVLRVLAEPGAVASRAALQAALQAAFVQELALDAAQAAAWTELALEQVWPGPDGSALPAEGCDAEGLALNINTLQDDTALQDLAGVGLLLRRRSPAPSGWRCPLRGQGVGGPDGAEDLTWTPALAVLPFQRMQGLLRTDAFYAGDTLVQFDDALAAQTQAGADDGAALQGMYHVRWPRPPAAVDALMQVPALAYGADYQFAAFGVPNPGVLPPALQAAGDPLQLRADLADPAQADTLLGDAPLSTVLPFRRTRAVQALEFVAPEAATSGDAPAALEPARAGLRYGREAPLRAFEAEVPAWMREADAPPRLAPLLLLPGLQDQASLRVRAPRSDCQTFLRWCEYDRLAAAEAASTSADPAVAALSADWDRFLLAAEALRWALEDEADPARRAAALPPDPAVAALEFSLLDEAGRPVGEVRRVVLRSVLPQPLKQPFGHADLRDDDRGSALLRLRHMAGAAPALDVAGDTVDVLLPEESIHYLRICPQTAEADRARFATAADAARWPGVLLPVEVGTRRAALNGRDLHTALALQLVQRESVAPLPATEPARDILLRLDVPAARRRDFRLLHQIEVGVQLWRWQGRPFPAPPRGVAAPQVDTGEAVDLRWEADTFADRSEEPGQTVMRRLLDGSSLLLRREAAGNDRRERWFRFRVSAVQRYSGLYRAHGNPLPAEAERVVAAQPRTLPIKDSSFHLAQDPWLRARRPAGSDGAVPAPLLKAFVPLTLAAGGAEAAGVLCLLNESFCEVGGLAEGLEAAIEQVAVEKDGRRHVLEEYGHDPVFSGVERDADTAPRALAVTGPLGHTFDTDTRAPLFVASSFVLDPPPGTRSFDFFKLRLRRVLDPAGCGDAPGVPVALDAAQLAARGEYVAELAAGDVGAAAALNLGSGAGAVRCALRRDSGTWQFDLPAPWQRVLRTPGVPAQGALRLCLKRLREIRRDGVLQGSEWELAIAARATPQAAWRRIAVAVYAHEDAAAPLGFALALQDCAQALVASGPRLSDYTPATWVQCLPDRGWLLPAGFADCSLRRSAGTGFRLIAAGQALALRSRVPADPPPPPAGSAATAAAAGVAAADSEPPRGIAQLLLLTRSQRGLDGREFESFVGLYACDGASRDWRRLEGREVTDQDSALQGRVLWVQVVPTRFGEEFSADTFWALCFPPTAPGAEAEDAQARIVGVSQRFALQQEVAVPV